MSLGDSCKISEMSLEKICQLEESRNPPLSKAMFVHRMLTRTELAHQDGYPLGTQSKRRPESSSACITRLKGFVGCVTSALGISFPTPNFMLNGNKLIKSKSSNKEQEEDFNKSLNTTSRNEHVMQIRNVMNAAQEVRISEEEHIRRDLRLVRERGSQPTGRGTPVRGRRDPSKELLKAIVDPTPIDRIPPIRFLKVD